MWHYHTRISYESALRRATVETLKAMQCAVDEGEEGLAEDLTAVASFLSELRSASVGGGPAPDVPAVIPGQTSLS